MKWVKNLHQRSENNLRQQVSHGILLCAFQYFVAVSYLLLYLNLAALHSIMFHMLVVGEVHCDNVFVS